MSDQEFDNYLTLLASLLRLDKSQQRTIAGELRTHLEDRLDDLLARGVPQEEAIRTALAEFGDAAGLAAQFVSLSRNRKRRWLMRTATFSVAAVVLVAVGLITFWPGRNAGPGTAAVVAQAAPAEAPPKPPADKQLKKVVTFADKLNQRVDGEFVETPLSDVLDYLADQSEIQFYVNRKRLEDNGTALDSPVTKSLKNVRLSTLLDLILGELNLVYVEKDELLMITTIEDAESTMEVRVYDCRDLLTMAAPLSDKGKKGGGAGGLGGVDPSAAPQAPGVFGGGEGGPLAGADEPPSDHDGRAERLMNIIITVVDNQSWNDVGGPGSISEYNGLIVISQSARTHQKVEKVLDMLRQAAGQPRNGAVVR